MPSFSCGTCQKPFDVPEATLAKFPGWKPKQCFSCKKAASSASTASGGGAKPFGGGNGARSSARETNYTTAQVLERYKEGPATGVFTDGAASPNPGPGGWGAVYVLDGRIVSERNGHEPQTTNNRMELAALIAGYQLVPPGVPATVFTDSQLCVNTITQWAASWEKRGWKKKDGEIKNLELVKALYTLAKSRPDIELRWIKAHAGSRWNEYADALATAYRRDER